MDIIEIERMTIQERLHTMELLWDSITHSIEDIEPPAWHGEILSERKKIIDSGEAEWLTMDELRKELMNACYITTEDGSKTDVILPVADYEALMEDLHDLAVIAERKEEPTYSLEEVKERLKADGLL